MREPRRPYESSGDDVDATFVSLTNSGHNRAAEWLADETTVEASRRRSAEYSRLRQIRESATLAGSLIELAERRSPITLFTTWGRIINGRVEALGEDFVELRGDAGSSVLRIESIAYLRAAAVEILNDREQNFGPGTHTFSERVRTLAIERPNVQITCQLGTVQVTGILDHVGGDVMTIAIDGPKRLNALVPLARAAQVQIV